MNRRQILSRGLLAGAALSAGALAERVTDPLDRHANDYSFTLITPNEDPEAPGVSALKRDESGQVERDALGDTLLIATLIGLAGGLAVRQAERSDDQDNQLQEIESTT